MTLESRLESLGQRHTELKSAVQEEMNHPAFDDIKLHDLKRQKLRIKDQIERLRSKSSDR